MNYFITNALIIYCVESETEQNCIAGIHSFKVISKVQARMSGVSQLIEAQNNGER